MSIQKDGSIVINSNDFIKGIQSAHFGMQEIRGLNVTNKAGVMTVNIEPIKRSASNVTDMIIDLSIIGNQVMGVSEDTVYKASGAGGGTWGTVTGGSSGFRRNINNWKDFFFVFFNNKIDVYEDDATIEQTNFQSLDISDYHPSIESQDGKFYIGNGYKVASLLEVGTFDPTNPGTYTFTSNALDIPTNQEITALGEIGEFLVIGTDLGYLYLWDRVSPSFNTRIVIEENEQINSIITYNNLLYIQAGRKMRIYVSNGTSSQLFYELPETLLDGFISSDYSSNMIIKDRDLLICYSGTSQVSPAGVYAIDLDTKAVTIRNIISTKEDGTNDEVQIPAILNTNKGPEIIYSWRDDENSSYGIDSISISGQKYYRDEAYFISQFYRTSTSLQPKTFQRVEVFLDENTDTLDDIMVYYRTTIKGDWTLIKDFNTDDKNYFQAPFTATTRNVQFKIVVNNDAEFLEFRAI